MNPHIWVEDVSQNRVLKDVAKWLCALSYSEYYGAGVLPYELLETFTESTKANSRVLIAFAKFGTHKEAEVLGTVSVRFGNENVDGQLAALEFMELFVPESESWDSFEGFGFCPERTMEGSRFSFSRRCMKRTPEAENLRIEVCRRLYGAASILGKAHGCDQHWSILPKHIAAFVRRSCGYSVQQVAGVRLNREKYAHVYEKCSVYWEKCKPAIYVPEMPATHCINPISFEAVPISPTASNLDSIGGENRSFPTDNP